MRSCYGPWQRHMRKLAGQFGKAIESARTAMQLRRSEGDDSLAPELQQQIALFALYELGLPYRETAK